MLTIGYYILRKKVLHQHRHQNSDKADLDGVEDDCNNGEGDEGHEELEVDKESYCNLDDIDF